MAGHFINELMMSRYSTILLATIMLWGCHGNTKTSSTDNTTQSNTDTTKHVQVTLPTPAKGVITDSIRCADNSTQVYAIYLPTYYTASKKWPVIYFFDPHGVGNLPIKIYKDLAEKYGFVIAGTYGSKNGMQISESSNAGNAMMSDVAQRVSVDNARLYTFGFSGGARVASTIALNGGIAGVIACGAGFAQSHPQITVPFSILLFVGEKILIFWNKKNLTGS